MRFAIVIESGNEKHAFGVIVPDLSGCFSAGDTLDDAIDNAKEAIELWLEETIDSGGAIPDHAPSLNINPILNTRVGYGRLLRLIYPNYRIKWRGSISHSLPAYCAVSMQQRKQRENRVQGLLLAGRCKRMFR